MICYIKDIKTFETLAKYDVTSYSLPEGTDGEIVIYQKDAVQLTNKYAGMWTIINKELFYISELTPSYDYITLKIQPPMYAFSRQVEIDSTYSGLGYGQVIKRIIDQNFGTNCPDADYKMSYLSAVNTNNTAFTIKTDDYGFVIPYEIIDDALNNGVAVDFEFTNDALTVQSYTANYDTGIVVFNDGDTILEAESYDPSFVSKVTVIHDLDSEVEDGSFEIIDYYLAEDNTISTSPPAHRAKGIWKYYTAEVDDNPLNVARGVFSHNNDNHKIEFHSSKRFNLYQPIKMRLRGEIFNTIIKSRVLTSEDSRYYYTCGTLSTTLTEKINDENEENTSEIKQIKKKINTISSETEAEITRLLISIHDLPNYGISIYISGSTSQVNATIAEIHAAIPNYSTVLIAWTQAGNTTRFGTLAGELPGSNYGMFIYEKGASTGQCRFVVFNSPTTYIGNYSTVNSVGFSGWAMIMKPNELTAAQSYTINGVTFIFRRYGKVVVCSTQGNLTNDAATGAYMGSVTVSSSFYPITDEIRYIMVGGAASMQFNLNTAGLFKVGYPNVVISSGTALRGTFVYMASD